MTAKKTPLVLLWILVASLSMTELTLGSWNQWWTYDDDGISGCRESFFPCDESTPSEVSSVSSSSPSNNKSSVICIHRSFHCDKRPDCPNGEDEKNCGYLLFDIRSKYQSQKLNSLNDSSLTRYHNNFYGNCSLYDLIIGNCSCDFDHREKAHCKSQGFTSIPEFFQKSITSLNLENNLIDYIDSHVVNTYVNLTIISLRFNRISHIQDYAFHNLSKLTRLYLRGNVISSIGPLAFSGLLNLEKLYVNDNLLKVISLSIVFVQTPRLRLLDLAQNQLSLHSSESFPFLDRLDWIDLSQNRLYHISNVLFRNLANLTKLHVQSNEISRIDRDAFSHNRRLLELDLSHNPLPSFPASVFDGLQMLRSLDLSDNFNVQSIPLGLFSNLTYLKSLNLTGVRISNINKYHFWRNHNLTHIYFSRFKYCLFAPQVRICHPSSDGVSSLEHLLVYPILRVSVWIVASMTCLGNLVVITWRSVSTHEDSLMSLFVKNLSMADLLMGVYLVSIGLNDIGFKDQYLLFALDWMTSWTCTWIGFLAMISSELSVLILTIVAVERYRSIAFNSRLLTLNSARMLMAMAWVFSVGIAAYPLIPGISGAGNEYEGLEESELMMTSSTGYYGCNGLCFPLHIDDPFAPGWTYSAVVFLGINLCAVITMLLLYLRMFMILNRDRSFARPGSVDKDREDVVLAVRFFFIVSTDCLCWLPIVVIKIRAFTGIEISPTIYAWVVVFVLPINSALNPILYTMAAPTEIRSNLIKCLNSLVGKVMSCFHVICPSSLIMHSRHWVRRRTNSSTVTTAGVSVEHVDGEMETGKRPSNGSMVSMVTMSTLRASTCTTGGSMCGGSRRGSAAARTLLHPIVMTCSFISNHGSLSPNTPSLFTVRSTRNGADEEEDDIVDGNMLRQPPNA